jgi:hypothetical protein
MGSGYLMISGGLFWLASFTPTCMLSHPCHRVVALPCGSGALLLLLCCHVVCLASPLFCAFYILALLLLLLLVIPSASFFFFNLILRFLLAIFRGVYNGLFDTVYLQPGALGIKQSSYVISRTRLIFLTCTSFYQ